LKIAGQASPDRAAVAALSRTIDEALETAEAAGYRVDKLLGTANDEAKPEPEVEPAVEAEPSLEGGAEPEPIIPDEPEAGTEAKPSGPGEIPAAENAPEDIDAAASDGISD